MGKPRYHISRRGKGRIGTYASVHKLQIFSPVPATTSNVRFILPIVKNGATSVLRDHCARRMVSHRPVWQLCGMTVVGLNVGIGSEESNTLGSTLKTVSQVYAARPLAREIRPYHQRNRVGVIISRRDIPLSLSS